MSEKRIIELLKNRDETGLDELLVHFSPLMRYVISPILQNEQDREECLSETAMRVWEKIELYDESRGGWTAWLTTLARNAALNRARALGRREGETELSETVPSSELQPEEFVLRQERQAAVKRAVAGLNPKERTIFYRKYYYMQSTVQIAAELGMTERAVEGKLYRMKRRLRDALGGEGFD